MNRIHGMVIALVMLAALGAAAETLDAGPFSVDVASELTVRFNGVTLIEGDRCVAFQGMRPDPRTLVDPAGGEVLREGNTMTVLAVQGRNTLRREVMVTAEAVHITFEMRVFGATGGSHLQYDLRTPGAYVDGVEYQAWTGRPRGPLQTETGTFSTEDTEPFEYLVRTGRYFILQKPGAECSLDFNPVGPWVGESNYGENYSANPYHDGEDFRWLMLCSGGANGGIFRGKIIIRPGVVPWESVHSTTEVAYTRGFPASLAVNFSRDEDPSGDYVASAGDDACRWREPASARIVERDSGGLLYRDFAAPAEEGASAALEIAQRSGHYLLTMNLRDPQERTGPFTVTGPDGPLFEDVTVEAGDYWFDTAHLRFRDGAATLRFTGHWKVGALALQPIIYDTEDFIIGRPFWNMQADHEVGG